MTRNLNSVKINLVNKVRNNQSFFYNNSSMNSFINKIVKTNRFNKIDEYREMLEYIIDNEIEYKTKIFDELQSDIKLPKLLENRTEEIITISYSKLTADGEDKIENEISRQIINMHNKHPNNLIKVTSSYPNKYEFDMKIEPSEFTNYTMKFIKYLVFFLLNEDSDHYYPSMYYAKKENRLTDVEIKITSYPKINGYSLSDHYRTIQKFEDSKSILLCVPTAIKNYFINKQSETTNERTFNKYKTMINTITQPKYNKSYTVDELKTLSDELKISFTITDFVNEPIYIGKNSSNSHNIKLINTRMNHLENYCNQEVKIDSNQVDVILTSGGTGFSDRDFTPEAIRPLFHREAPIIAQVLVNEGLKFTPLAAMSRPVAGVRHKTFICTLPGSVKAVKENITALKPLLPRIVELLVLGNCEPPKMENDRAGKC